MATKSCVYCLGELRPSGPARKAKGGKFTRRFRCDACGRDQTKLLEPGDPYAGTPTPKSGGRKKKSAKPIPPGSLVHLTPALAAARPSPKSLAAHSYQRKLAAHYAPHILPSAFQALKTGVEAGNSSIIKMVLELYELVQTDKRVSIVNDNRSVTIDARNNEGGVGDGRRSFETTARMLDQSREKRLAQGNPLATHMIEASLAETPGGVSK